VTGSLDFDLCRSSAAPPRSADQKKNLFLNQFIEESVPRRKQKKEKTMSGTRNSAHRSPTVSFLSPPPPPRSGGSYHEQHGGRSNGGGGFEGGGGGGAPSSIESERSHGSNRSSSGRHLSSTAMLSSGGGGGSGSAASASSTIRRSSGRSSSRSVSIASANSAFTPRKLLDAVTPASAGSHQGSATGSSNHNSSSSRGNGNGNGNGNAVSSALSSAVSATPTSMMLVPASQTISESLQSLADATATQLEEVWDEVGYSPDERAAQLSDLILSFRRICDDKVAEERGVAVTFRNEIEAARREIVSTGKALRVSVDPTLLGEEKRNDGSSNHDGNGTAARPYHQTLTDELAALEVTLEEFRSNATTATADLTECMNKMLTAHAALGTELEEEWRDVTTDLTDERREAFHGRVAVMEREVELRKQTTIGLLKDCQHLIRELRVDTDQSSTGRLDRQIMGSLARDPKTDAIVMTSTDESDDCTGITSRALSGLTERVSELNGEKRRRKARLGEMGAEIATLWEKLHVPDHEQRAFAESVKGLGMDTIQKGEDELRRLLDLKAAMMGRLIDEAREQIELLWKETSATDSQRAGFKGFALKDESQYTDELLSEHDSYIQYLQRRYEQMQPILKVIEKREEIIKERMEYEELQKDPTRLQQRGSALTKQLMREEKIARRIKKDLPKATSYLERKLRDWKKSNDEHFLYNGEVYLDIMSRQEEEWHEYKDKEMQLKLRKRQEEKVAASNRGPSDSGYYKPLPGKKRSGTGANTTHRGGSGDGTNNPLADAGNRTNRDRGGPSRAKSRGRAPGGFDPSKPSLAGAAGNGRAPSRSRPVSRGRMGMGASSFR